MMKEFQKAPVYTKDSVSYIKDDKKKQEVIDDMTSHLADRMVKITSDRVLVNEFCLDIALEEHRGGHNRMTVEMLNNDGYLVHVFHFNHRCCEILRHIGRHDQQDLSRCKEIPVW